MVFDRSGSPLSPGAVCWIRRGGSLTLTALGNVTGEPATVATFDGTVLPRSALSSRKVRATDLKRKIESDRLVSRDQAASVQAEYPHLLLTVVPGTKKGEFRLLKREGIAALGMGPSEYTWDFLPVQLYGSAEEGFAFVGHDEGFRADLFVGKAGILRAVYSTTRGDYDEAGAAGSNPVLRRAAQAARRAQRGR